MNSACTWWVLAGQIVSVLSINSTQTHWVNPPSPPVNAATSVGSLNLQPTDANTLSLVNDSLTSTTAMSVSSPDLQPLDVSEDTMDVDDSLGDGVPHANGRTLSSSSDISSTGTQATHDTDILPVMDIIVSPGTDAEVTTQVTASAATKFFPKATPSADSSVITPKITSHLLPLSASSNDIDVDSVPAFLHSHGKGKRKVNIFGYLNKVKDPRFQQVLQHYIRIEANDRSGVSGTLPTAKRPVEIGEWTTRARPERLLDFTKGK